MSPLRRARWLVRRARAAVGAGRARAALVVGLAFVAFLGPVAAATIVPDPDWIGGFFDGADGDELAALVWDRSVGAPPTLPIVLVLLCAALLAPLVPPPAPPGFAPAASSRAPPRS
jgi:hypothetical protein